MDYENKILQHLGIVAGVCQEIKLSDTIDRLIQKPNRKVSVGNAVQAMILNALGFSNKILFVKIKQFLFLSFLAGCEPTLHFSSKYSSKTLYPFVSKNKAKNMVESVGRYERSVHF